MKITDHGSIFTRIEYTAQDLEELYEVHIRGGSALWHTIPTIMERHPEIDWNLKEGRLLMEFILCELRDPDHLHEKIVAVRKSKDSLVCSL